MVNYSVLAKRIIFTLTLFGYITIAIFGFLHIAHAEHTGNAMENCPFAIGEHAICKMGIVEHISAWEKFSKTTFPLVLVLGVLLSTLYFENLKIFSKIRSYTRNNISKLFKIYQQLFSQGLLNPKAP